MLRLRSHRLLAVLAVALFTISSGVAQHAAGSGIRPDSPEATVAPLANVKTDPDGVQGVVHFSGYDDQVYDLAGSSGARWIRFYLNWNAV